MNVMTMHLVQVVLILMQFATILMVDTIAHVMTGLLEIKLIVKVGVAQWCSPF